MAVGALSLLWILSPSPAVSDPPTPVPSLRQEILHRSWPFKSEEQARLLAEPLVAIALPGHPPLSFRDSRGGIQGFGQEVADAVIRTVGGRVIHRPAASWSQALELLLQGEADLIYGVGFDPQLESQLSFTLPFLEMPERLFVLADRYDIPHFDDLDGKTVACVEGHATTLHLRAFHPRVGCLGVSDIKEALLRLIAGEVDGVVFPEQLARHAIDQLKLRTQLKMAGGPDRLVTWHMVVRKGNTPLRQLLDEGLVSVKVGGEWQVIHDRWLGHSLFAGYTQGQLWQWAVLGGGGTAMALGLLFAWWHVRQQRRANRDLAAAMAAVSRGAGELEQAHRLLRTILDALPVRVFWKDGGGGYLGCNLTFARDVGLGDPERVAGLHDEGLPNPRGAALAGADREVLESGESRLNRVVPWSLETGDRGWAKISTVPLRDGGGGVIGVIGVLEEITAQREMLEQLQRTNRALSVLGHGTTAISLARDEGDLLGNLCRILVEVGGYRMAWVGMARFDRERSVEPVAQYGFEEGYLGAIRISWGDNPHGWGPTGSAIRSRTPVCARDILHDPRFEPWRARAVARGYASSLALPLLAGERTLGALNLYAAEPNAFDVQEIALLQDLANNLALGLQAMATASQRAAAEARLERRSRLDRLVGRLSHRLLVAGVVDWEELLELLVSGVGAEQGELWRVEGTEEGAASTLLRVAACGPEEKLTPEWVIPELWQVLQGDLAGQGCVVFPPRGEETPGERLALLVVRGGSGGPKGLLRFTRGREAEWLDEELGALGMVADMVGSWWQRQEARDRLLVSENRYRRLSQEFQAILHAIREPIVLLSRTLGVEWVNGSAQRYLDALGVGGGEAACGHFLHEQNCAQCQEGCFLRVCLDQGRVLEERVAAPSGQTWKVRAFPVPVDAVRPNNVLLVMTDVTQLLTMQEHVMQGAHLASLGVLTASIAHEINNPNQMILTNSHLVAEMTRELVGGVERRLEGGERPLVGSMAWEEAVLTLDQLTAAIAGGSRRIKGMVGQLRDLARQENSPVDLPLSLAQVVNDAVALLSSRIAKSTENLAISIPSHLPPVRGNLGQLEQVVINLVVNALESLTHRSQGVRIEGEVGRGGEELVLRIVDQGCGIPPDILPHVTEPLFTTKGERGGTGLGLAVCRDIVRRHAGRLEVASREGSGTTVTVTLPVARSVPGMGE